MLSLVEPPPSTVPTLPPETVQHRGSDESGDKSSDQAIIAQWQQVAATLQEWALGSENGPQRYDAIDLVKRFWNDVFEIRLFMQAFNDSPKRALTGDRGVVAILGVSKPNALKRIHNLGLSTKIFQSADLKLADLVAQSDAARTKLQQMQALIESLKLRPKTGRRS